MARAEAAELDDDQTGLAPDEAALTWPENLSPAALAGLPRRLAIAAAYSDADDPGDQEEDDDEDYIGGPAETFRPGRYLQDVSYEQAGSERDRSQPEKDAGQDASSSRSAKAPEPKRHQANEDGTIHQFPPPAGNR